MLPAALAIANRSMMGYLTHANRFEPRSSMTNPHIGPVFSDVPVRTIDREELRQKLARGDRFKLVNCLNDWAF
jgi:hypothetical protein